MSAKHSAAGVRARDIATCALVLLLAPWATPLALAHPKPGAHADARIAVQDHSVRMDLLMNIMFVDGLIHSPRRRMDDVAPDEEAGIRAGLREYFQSASGELDRVASPTARAGSLTGTPRGVILDKPNQVLIDGFHVAPIEKEFSIIRPTPEDRPGFEQNPLLLMPQVHVVLEYPCNQPPRTVQIVWGTYPLDFLAAEREVPPPVTLDAQLTAEGDIHPITLTREEPGYTWHGKGTSAADRMARVPSLVPSTERVLPTLPVITLAAWLALSTSLLRRRGPRGAWPSLALAPLFLTAAWAVRDWGTIPLDRLIANAPTPRPPDDEAASIVTALQSNVYRAFDYTDESEVYEALAQSVDGPLLDAMYNQVYRSLVMYEEGGAVSRVKTVQPVSVQVSTPDPHQSATNQDGRFVADTRWRVEGVVYHWGHSHTRWNEYAARYEVAPTPQGWRIVDYKTREQFRIDPATGRAANLDAAETPQTPGGATWHPSR